MGRPKIILRPTPSIRKQAGQLMKLFAIWPGASKSSVRVSSKSNDSVSEGVPRFLAQKKGIDTKFITRRQVVLNRHFTELVSDVMSNSIVKQLSSLGVTITSIETKAWNKGLDIFYYSDQGTSIELQKELNSLIVKLRKELTDQHLIGQTPNIRFVADKTIQASKLLDQALANSNVKPQNEELQVTKLEPNSIDISSKTQPKFNCDPKGIKFNAPKDMSNMTLGLDYSKMYDEVASKLEYGRAQSTRIRPSDAIAKSTPTLFNQFPNELSKDDPMQRIIKMQNFLISQRKRSDRIAKQRRLDELLARDAVKWDIPPPDLEEE